MMCSWWSVCLTSRTDCPIVFILRHSIVDDKRQNQVIHAICYLIGYLVKLFMLLSLASQYKQQVQTYFNIIYYITLYTLVNKEAA